MTQRHYLGINVLEAANKRIQYVFDCFPKIYMSGPSGKDSGVMMHLICQEARIRKRKIGVLYIDLEAQYTATIDFVDQMFAKYADVIEPYWICLPVALRNAVSQFEPKWCAWDPSPGVQWIRQPPKNAITDSSKFPWFNMPKPGPDSGKTAMEFEEIIEKFGIWYADNKLTACFVGIRTQESLNRWRTICGNRKSAFIDPYTYKSIPWTTYKKDFLYNVYPIYDWKTEDIWRYFGKTKNIYPKTYDLMNKAGISINEMRICQPYGDDQRKGLWLYHLLEPTSWGKLVCRVAGANQGALYAQERGSILGRFTVSKPNQYSWEEYCQILLNSLPPKTKNHMENKIAIFVKWWSERGYSRGIPDEADSKLESAKKVPSWRRVAKMLLKNDYWAKSLSFGPTKSESYERYCKVMKKRKMEWKNLESLMKLNLY